VISLVGDRRWARGGRRPSGSSVSVRRKGHFRVIDLAGVQQPVIGFVAVRHYATVSRGFSSFASGTDAGSYTRRPLGYDAQKSGCPETAAIGPRLRAGSHLCRRADFLPRARRRAPTRPKTEGDHTTDIERWRDIKGQRGSKSTEAQPALRLSVGVRSV
jgi:hypothetical protein